MTTKNINDSLPVLVAVGQTVQRAPALDNLPSPLSLAVAASQAALTDSGIPNLAKHIDTIAFVRINSDSIPGRSGPFGRSDNLPRAVGDAIGADPARAIYSVVGGQAPQQLVNEMSARIAAGDCEVVLLTGSEAIGAMKAAQRSKLDISWAQERGGELEDRGTGPELISAAEIAGGMGNPPQVYGAFEHAWRHSKGLSKAEHQAHMAALFQPFTEVAAANPYAQFGTARSTEFLSTASQDNYPVADPFLKWHVAQDAVNQGAALVLMSVRKAKELGIDRERWVFPLGGADTQDKLVTLRPSLASSQAMACAADAALNGAGIAIEDVAHLDLYSCFPCAVQYACDALGLDPQVDVATGLAKRQLTQTGGLPFFGGAGNNYSMHGIASMVETLRADPGSTGFVLANGGFMSKESVGLYSTEPNPNWQPVNNLTAQGIIDDTPDAPQAKAPTSGQIEAYSVVYVKREPLFGYVFGVSQGERFLARTDTRDDAAISRLLDGDALGREVSVEPTAKRNRLLV